MRSTLNELVGTVLIQNELNDVNWIELIWIAWWERTLRICDALALLFWQCFIIHIDCIFFYVNKKIVYKEKPLLPFFKINTSVMNICYITIYYVEIPIQSEFNRFFSILFNYWVIIHLLKLPFRGCLEGSRAKKIV